MNLCQAREDVSVMSSTAVVPGAGKHVLQSAGEHIKIVPGAGKRKRSQAKENADWSLIFYEFLEQSYRPTNVKLDCSRPVMKKGQLPVFLCCT